ncbi:hypothetical protein SAMN04488000_12683 [Lentzea albida]|uniref:Uncharacterized protein n=1 Tax=Lentzea albida TaxID=65499 RepID=A0A1H9X1I9_9PSEU|nr:hypothetical protein SAMN04488000_12683 [Lentzea albida]
MASQIGAVSTSPSPTCEAPSRSWTGKDLHARVFVVTEADRRTKKSAEGICSEIDSDW